jgi:hypothetical protein
VGGLKAKRIWVHKIFGRDMAAAMYYGRGGGAFSAKL